MSCYGVYYSVIQNIFDEWNVNIALPVYVIVMHTTIKGSNIFDLSKNDIAVHSAYVVVFFFFSDRNSVFHFKKFLFENDTG